jgi:hypothetical protein
MNLGKAIEPVGIDRFAVRLRTDWRSVIKLQLQLFVPR